MLACAFYSMCDRRHFPGVALLNSLRLVGHDEPIFKVDPQRTWLQKGRLSDPFYGGDQDVINRILGAHLEAGEIALFQHRLALHPTFPGLSLIVRDVLLCRYPDDARPFVLHQVLAKPSLKATLLNVCMSLPPRLLLGADVALRLEPGQISLRLREGRRAAVDRRRADAQSSLAQQAVQQLCRFGMRTRIRRRLAAVRERRTAVRACQPSR
jgi:hypothetical protein